MVPTDVDLAIEAYNIAIARIESAIRRMDVELDYSQANNIMVEIVLQIRCGIQNREDLVVRGIVAFIDSSCRKRVTKIANNMCNVN